jgi:hypothetical protein
VPDEFDRFLGAALSPKERDPDRQFVARVEARIALEQQLARERRSLLAGLLKQLVALLAVAAGVWWVGRAAPVAMWVRESPEAALLLLLAAFVFLIVLFSARASVATATRAPLRTVSTA